MSNVVQRPTERRSLRKGCLAFCAEGVTGGNHGLDLGVGDGAVQDDGVPVGLVHVVRREDRGVGAAEGEGVVGVAFHVYPDTTVALEDPSETAAGVQAAHDRPVGVVEGVVLVGLGEGQAEVHYVNASF